MPDPFEQLRAALAPEEPDPRFVARLRNRLEQALRLPKGAAVPDLAVEVRGSATTAVITPYLAVAGARAAIDWYRRALGARLFREPVVMPDGRVGHAELEVGGATFMLADESPESGVAAPAPGQTVPVTLHLEVPDVDAIVDRAIAAGAQLERPLATYEYGRNGVVRDPFGHRWLITGMPSTPSLRHGDIGYVSLWVPEVRPRRGLLFGCARMALLTGQQPERPSRRRAQSPSRALGPGTSQYPVLLLCRRRHIRSDSAGTRRGGQQCE